MKSRAVGSTVWHPVGTYDRFLEDRPHSPTKAEKLQFVRSVLTLVSVASIGALAPLWALLFIWAPHYVALTGFALIGIIWCTLFLIPVKAGVVLEEV